MKRHAAYDPPEYLNWAPTPEVMERYAALAQEGERGALISALSEERLLWIYEQLLLTRLHDTQLKRWVKQGVISKAWLGTGEEAATVGVCAALQEGDVVGPMIRNAGALIVRGVPLEVCFAAYLGTTDTLARGRDLHIGDPSRGVIPPISHVGDILPVMAGCALAFKLAKEPRVALTWTGDGSTATGIFHEGMRVASALGAPLISVIQDNRVALGTLTETHSRNDLRDLAAAYGAPVWEVDGNHALDCYAATALAAQTCRAGEGPAVLIARTFRMGGHATHDEREARRLIPASAYAEWGARDPIGCYEEWLISARHIPRAQLETIEATLTEQIDAAARAAAARKESHAPKASELLEGVYAAPLC